MLILIGETMCPDQLKKHSKYNNTSGMLLAVHYVIIIIIYIFSNIFIEFNIQYFSIIESIAFNTDFNIVIQLN